MKITYSVLSVISLTVLLSGCSGVGVKPWERDIMATRAMQLNTQPNITAFHDHNYFSKEGSSGGRTFDGGGCGCN